jgi:hypothetical protein
MSKMESQVKLWENKCKVLIGKKIKEVRYMTVGEVKKFMWNCRSVVIIFEDGTYLIPSCDDEGNDGGSIFTNIESLPTIPVIY